MFRIALLFLVLVAMQPAQAAPTENVQTRIFHYFLKRAQEGDMNSQFVVGSRYESGVGVPQDKTKAYEWYAKSAAQGHPLAMQRVEAHSAGTADTPKSDKKDIAPSRAPKPAPKPASRVKAAAPEPVAVAAPRPAPVPRRAPAASPVSKAPETAVIKAAAEPAVDTLDILMKGSWRRRQGPAEYLPSAMTSCLQSGEDEMICFSDTLQRTVGSSLLTYTVKATLTHFAKDGSFDVSYLYNVTNIDKADKPAPNQDKDGPSDLAVKLGWQEPARRLDCKTSSEKSLTCIKDKRYSLHFVK